MNTLRSRAIVSGILAVVIGLIATVIADLFFPTTNLLWALIAVGFASFFAGSMGYYSGYKREVEIAAYEQQHSVTA